MKFSVIIPLYNKAPYIRKALESVLAQAYTDYEVIVVDDGSTDESASIVESMLCEVMRLQGYKATRQEDGKAEDALPNRQSPIANRLMLLKQQNAGVSAARNNGVALSHGDYLAFLDADDWWEPTYLEKMAQLIEDYPEAGLYASNYVYYKPGKTRVALNIPTGYINYPKAYYESNAMPIWTGAAMIQRKVFEEMGGFLLGIKLGEDFLLWSKIAMQYKVAFLNEALAWYNNDVPATLRATMNLHAPEHHMLFRMEEIIGESLKIKGEEISRADTNAYNLSPITYKPTNDDWRRLLDKLRVNGLLGYWLDKRYHDQAAEELKKVDWTKQPASVIRLYKTPIWILKVNRLIMSCGSFVKRLLFRGRQ